MLANRQTIQKQTMAKELNMSMDDLNCLLLEWDDSHDIDSAVIDYETYVNIKTTTLTHRSISRTEDKTGNKLTLSEKTEIVQQMGVQSSNLAGCISALDQLQLAERIISGSNQAALEHAAYQQTKQKLIESDIAASVARIKQLKDFDLDATMKRYGLSESDAERDRLIVESVDRQTEVDEVLSDFFGKKPEDLRA
ncbi:MAG: hypothetical protein LRZ84_14660 [Desertifilum sp.]|nr:hypothetical protein [Desertifilum sp.]